MRSVRALDHGDRVRVLVVDDSVVVRRSVSLALEADPQIEVVGVASSGELALLKVDQLNPDLVTLDVEMPGMNGLDTLTELRKRRPDMRVLMLSSLTQSGAEVTMEALARGADDCASKSSGGHSIEESINLLRDQLCGKIKQFFRFHRSGSEAAANQEIASNPHVAGGRKVWTGAVEAILIGISTGGPAALAHVIPALGGLQVPLLIVQHMPPMFTKLLAQRLNSQSQLQVVEAEAGMLLEPGTVYIAPGDFHMSVRPHSGGRVKIQLDQGPPENCCRPAVDVLFRRAADVWGKRAAAVIMTGMGHDGLAGARTMWAAGSMVLAQDEETSVVWGMPGEIAKAGLADRVLPLEEIPTAILGISRRSNR